MLLVDCTVILSFWCILYSFLPFPIFKQCLCNALAFQKGPCKLVRPVSTNAWSVPASSPSCHISPRSSFCLHKDSTHNCNVGSQQWSAQPLALSLSKSCFCHSISLSVAGLSAANSPAPAS